MLVAAYPKPALHDSSCAEIQWPANSLPLPGMCHSDEAGDTYAADMHQFYALMSRSATILQIL